MKEHIRILIKLYKIRVVDKKSLIEKYESLGSGGDTCITTLNGEILAYNDVINDLKDSLK